MNHSAHINRLFNVVEESNPYTFGGVTTSLTDTEFASVMTELSNRRKIHAILMVRDQGHLSLKDAKDFVDHLNNIMSKMSEWSR